jgi:hypothetical protein
MLNPNRDVELLWQCAGMAPKRAFWIMKSVAGFPCVGACTKCGRVFRSQIAPVSTMNEIAEDLLEQFDQHDCYPQLISRKHQSGDVFRD